MKCPVGNAPEDGLPWSPSAPWQLQLGDTGPQPKKPPIKNINPDARAPTQGLVPGGAAALLFEEDSGDSKKLGEEVVRTQSYWSFCLPRWEQTTPGTWCLFPALVAYRPTIHLPLREPYF